MRAEKASFSFGLGVDLVWAQENSSSPEQSFITGLVVSEE